MKSILILGISVVQLALISYATAIIIQSRKKAISRTVLIFLTLGVIFDISSTIFMIIGSGRAISLHGFIGYSSLAGMLTDTILSYLNVHRNGMNFPLSEKFLRGSKVAFAYWVVAYITGAILVMTA